MTELNLNVPISELVDEKNFTFDYSHRGYRVFYNGQFICAGGTMNDVKVRRSKANYKHEADLAKSTIQSILRNSLNSVGEYIRETLIPILKENDSN